MRSWLPRLAVDRPVTVLMAFLALLVLGWVALSRIPLMMLPSGFDPPFLYLYIPYANSTPADTDEQVVQPMLEQLGTVPGIKRVRSRANTSGAGFPIQFHQSVDMDSAYNTIADRVERTLPDLPAEVERYFIWKYNPSDEPILWMGVSLPEALEDPFDVMDRVVKPRIERTSGVASVDVWGVYERIVSVYYNRDEVLSRGVDLGSFQRSIGSDNFQLAAGRVVDEGRIHYVRSLSRFEDIEDIAYYPVRQDLTLDGFADVGFALSANPDISRIDGKDAAAFAVRKESAANAVEVSKAVRDVLAELEGDPRLEGARFHVLFDQGDLIEGSVDTLTNTALQGGLFAVVILWLFLREWRMTLLITASIPFSLLVTVGALYFTGNTLNLLSLMGLMLAVGMVVDNAVVVVETIYRRRADGLSPREAAIEGTAEVNLAILMSTMTTMVVFLPLILMSQDAMFSFFMGSLGFPVVWALAASLVVALVFTPLATRYIPHSQIKEDPAWLQWLSRKYLWLLEIVLRRRVETALVIVLGAIFTLQGPMNWVPDGGTEDENLGDFDVRITVPREASPSERDQIMSTFEGWVEDHKDEWGVRVYRTNLGDGRFTGELTIYLEDDGPMDRADVIEAAKEELPKVPGVRARIGWGEEAGNQFPISLYGDEPVVLDELAQEVIRRAQSVPGVMGASQTASADGQDEIRLVLDREALLSNQINAGTVANTVAYAMRGQSLNPLLEGEREVGVVTRFHPDDRDNIETLLDFPVWSPAVGGSVPLRALTKVEVGRGPSSINREGGRAGTSIQIDLEEGANKWMMRSQVEAALEDMVLPRGYSFDASTGFAQDVEDNEAQSLALLLSVTFVFLLMGMLFESLLLPVAIITTIPMAMLGVYWGLFATQTAMGTLGGVGMVILVGVVVNNGIVLVDLVTQLRAEGMERTKALLEAGERRLRPILMTALTTICGLLPMALGKDSFIGIPYAPLGRVVTFGLIAATVLTLFLVPYLYALLDDVRNANSRWLAWVRTGGQKSQPSPGK